MAAFSPTLGRTIPNLSTLVLTGNRLAELSDLDALGGLVKLTHLVLLENPVCAREVRRLRRQALVNTKHGRFENTKG